METENPGLLPYSALCHFGYLIERKPDGWGGRWELNPQRPEPQSGALPIELLPPYPVDCSTGLKECQKPDRRNGYTGARETSRAKEEIRFSRGQCQRIQIPWPATELNQGDS